MMSFELLVYGFHEHKLVIKITLLINLIPLLNFIFSILLNLYLIFKYNFLFHLKDNFHFHPLNIHLRLINKQFHQHFNLIIIFIIKQEFSFNLLKYNFI